MFYVFEFDLNLNLVCVFFAARSVNVATNQRIVNSGKPRLISLLRDSKVDSEVEKGIF